MGKNWNIKPLSAKPRFAGHSEFGRFLIDPAETRPPATGPFRPQGNGGLPHHPPEWPLTSGDYHGKWDCRRDLPRAMPSTTHMATMARAPKLFGSLRDNRWDASSRNSFMTAGGTVVLSGEWRRV